MSMNYLSVYDHIPVFHIMASKLLLRPKTVANTELNAIFFGMVSHFYG